MTAQLTDIVKYSDTDYPLAEYEGDGLFEPGDYNIKVATDRCSACWKGYLVGYEIRRKNLFLNTLDVYTKDKYAGRPVPFYLNIAEREKKSFFNPKPKNRIKVYRRIITEPIVDVPPPPINGVEPKESDFFDYSYENLNLKMQFTGVLLVTDGLIKELIRNMGNHPAWKYEKVIALCFKAGEMIESKDISGDVEKIRDSMQKEDQEIEQKSTAGWIVKSFSSKQTLVMLNKFGKEI